jgi:antitoxin CcdA
MKASAHTQVRKRPVNLTLNEDLLRQVRLLTPNLSGVVEGLLTEFVEQEKKRRFEQSQQLEATIALWNVFEEQHGAFADEYSTL